MKAALRAPLPFGFHVLATGGLATAWVVYLAFHQGLSSARVVSNVGLITAAFVAAASCAARSRRSTDGSKRAWLLFAASCASWGLGQTTWTQLETAVGRQLPFPSLADIGYLGAVPLAVAAILSLPSSTGSSATRVRLVLDGLVTASSLMVVGWALALGPLVHAHGQQRLQLVISLAHPVGDVVMVAMALASISRCRRTDRAPLGNLVLISGALMSLAVADGGFTYLTTKDLYQSGNPIDAGWFIGFSLLYLASRSPRRFHPQQAADDVPRRAAAGTPYFAVLGAIAAAGGLQVFGGGIEAFVVWNLVVTMLLLAARQYLSILENHSLARTLEERVRVRTDEVRTIEERFRSLVQNSSDVVTILEPDGSVRYQSASVERVFGYEPDQLIGTAFAELVHPDDLDVFAESVSQAGREPGGTALVELGLLHRDGHWCRSETAITNLLEEPSVRGVVCNTRDISERKLLEDQLVRQAFHDPLTGLANASLFRDRIGHALAQRHLRRRAVAVLFCDLDGFKRVNDSLGHASGDQLLKTVGERLTSIVRPGDTVARLGGDEFAVLLEDVMFEAEANVVAERLSEALRAPIVIDGRELFVSSSIGIALAELESETPDSLLRNADLAMYRAKSEGLGGYKRFEGTMRTAWADRTGVESDLHHALARTELSLEYQPIVHLQTGRMVGVEALARWDHPTRGRIPPNEFIPLAECSALIVDIGRWVLQEACAQVGQWSQSWGEASPSVSVNLSGRQLLHPGLATDVAVALQLSGLEPSQLVLEMTESVLLEHNDETVATLRLLRDLGVRLAIDDFGTGYSSLSYLHRFPFDVLKIDRSFVERLSLEEPERSLASGIVRLGEGLDLKLVAEGIEEPDQLHALRTIGCELGQGYYFSRPLPAAQLTEFARTGATAAFSG